ncbi:MAG: hypothetical protein A3G07_02935 [Candidatus Doudnabacteria bacterium RIFCSPLOWO2_12_FULL_47_12]|nr:MAG: hypothetical protein A3G07_02935 [Candidatus Doudnabacteria bacterium RIFCSPLOWO2_12_FULL_47_12]
MVIGGGPIGTEFTEIFTSFGRPVTLLQREPQILQREDKDIADYVQKELEHRGVHIILDCEIIDVTRAGSYKIIRGRAGGREFNVEGAEILVATGRRANLDLNLEAAGVKVTPQGRLELNEYLQTSQAHIWAAGDAAGNWQFTHTAAYEGDLVGRNICHRHDEKTNYDVVPRVTFCDPEVASVGITEAQAKTKNIPYKAGTYKIGGLGRYLINRDSRGFIKLIVEPSSGLILGGHVVGESAGQLLHEIALAMKAKIPVTTMARMIHAYPTFSEAVGAAAENLTAQR